MGKVQNAVNNNILKPIDKVTAHCKKYGLVRRSITTVKHKAVFIITIM